MGRKDEAGDLKKWLVYFAISVASAVIVVGIFTVATKDETKDIKSDVTETKVTNKEIIAAVVRSCENNGNPLREVVQEGLEEDIEQAEDKQLYEELLPEADPVRLDRLIRSQVRAYRKRLSKIEPLDCSKQYPSPESDKDKK